MPPQTPNRDRLSLIEADIQELPSILAQIVYLVQLRDPNTGVYSHPAVPDRSRVEEVTRALKTTHERSFRRWLNLGLEAQKADLDLYLSSLGTDPVIVVGIWLNIETYRCFIPASASPAERQLFFSDIDLLLRPEGADVREQSARPPDDADVRHDSDILAVEDVAAWLHVAHRTLRQWAEVGEIPAYKTGKLWRFNRKEVEEWLRGQIGRKNITGLRHLRH